MIPEVAAIFSAGPKTLTCEWQPLQGCNPPTEGGLYALGFSRAIQYDRGVSRIVYIGSAANLQKRLAVHCRHPHNSAIQELKKRSDLLVAWWALPPIDRLWLYTLEGEAICAFERTFGTIPFGNQAVPESPHAKLCRDLIVVRPCIDADPFCLDGLENKVRRRFRPAVGMKLVTANEWFYEGVVRPSAEEIAARELRRDNEYLATVWSENVAAWNLTKMKAIIEICKSLRPLPIQSSATRFASLTRKIPRPHTWGEIAIVQGRIVAGTWLPKCKLWIKVLHDKELLGDARLEDWGYSGTDRSDLPQRKKPRLKRHHNVEQRSEAIFSQANQFGAG